MSQRIERLPGLEDPILAYVRSGLQQGLQHAASRERKNRPKKNAFKPRYYILCMMRAERADHDRHQRAAITDLDTTPLDKDLVDFSSRQYRVLNPPASFSKKPTTAVGGVLYKTDRSRRRDQLYREAWTAVIRRNAPMATKARRFLRILARRDLNRDWEAVERPISTQESVDISLHTLNIKKLALGESKRKFGKKRVYPQDPFLEHIFDDNGQLLKELTCRLTGWNSDEMKVFFTDNSFGWQELTNPYQYLKSALRYETLQSLYKGYDRENQKRNWDTSIKPKDTCCCFAQVRSEEGETLLSLEFIPDGFDQFSLIGKDENKGIYLPSGSLRIVRSAESRIGEKMKRDQVIPLLKDVFGREEEAEGMDGARLDFNHAGSECYRRHPARIGTYRFM